MSARTYVHIEFERLKLTPSFFETLDVCFGKHGLSPAPCAIIIPIDPAGDHKVAWKEIGKAFLWGKFIRAGYMAEPHHAVTINISYDQEYICDHLRMVAPVWAFGWEYDQEEKEKNLKLEAVCLELHNSLHAYNTVAKAEGKNDEPWFRFSKQEWKPLGELPMDDSDKADD